MRKEKPLAETIFPWLQVNLGKQCLGVLTGTDYRALRAAVQIVGLMACDDHPSLYEAFGAVVGRMQPTARHLAYHAIAHALDWSDRSRIWRRIGLEVPTSRCEHEPRNSGGQR
jgi:hypothetical protein